MWEKEVDNPTPKQFRHTDSTTTKRKTSICQILGWNLMTVCTKNVFLLMICILKIVDRNNCSHVLPYTRGQCSTSCGLGAVWRTLACSTGSDSDCDPAKRPAPAQRCYLRPCATWKVPEWSKVRTLVLFCQNALDFMYLQWHEVSLINIAHWALR